jgi:Zn-dependent alcohol dehydrogenase
LGTSGTPSTFGQPVTFTASVTSGAGTPAGTVTFKDGPATLGIATLSGAGVASFPTSLLAAGSHSITAVYNGNANFATSTSAALTQTVNQSATTVSLAATKDTSTRGQTVTFTVTVNSTTSGTPTGTVTFFDGTTNLGAASINGAGQAMITLTNITVGKHEITVSYSGDGNFPPNSSLAVIHYRSPKPR